MFGCNGPCCIKTLNVHVIVDSHHVHVATLGSTGSLQLFPLVLTAALQHREFTDSCLCEALKQILSNYSLVLN